MLRFALATGSTKSAVLVFAWTIRSFLASIVWDAAHPVRSAIAAAVRTRIAAFAPMNPPVGLRSAAIGAAGVVEKAAMLWEIASSVGLPMLVQYRNTASFHLPVQPRNGYVPAVPEE